MIQFLTKDDIATGSSRQRAFLVADELQAQGFEVNVQPISLVRVSTTPWPGKIEYLVQYIRMFVRLKSGDILYLQRAIYNKYIFLMYIFFKYIKGYKIIFDIDDAIYSHSPLKAKLITRIADAVMVGSHALQDWSLQYNRHVHFITTSVSFALYDKYSIKSRPKNEIPIIGWVGYGAAHYENLKLLIPVFEQLISRGRKFKFVLIGSMGSDKLKEMFQSIVGLDVEFIDNLDWGVSGIVPQNIQRFDIGLMPLIDDVWNRGKCAFKAIEYMACGIPTIASPVGESRYLIQDGRNGYLATDSTDWANKIEKILTDEKLRQELSFQGQETIKSFYSFESNIRKITIIFDELLDRS